MNNLTQQVHAIELVERKEGSTMVQYLKEVKKTQKALFDALIPQSHYYSIGDNLSLSQGGADYLRLALGLTAETTHEEHEWKRDVSRPVDYHYYIEAVCNIYQGDRLVASEMGQCYSNDSGANQRDSGEAKYQITAKARKRAYVRAINQATGLRALFTQDLEDIDPKKLEKAKVVKEETKKITRDGVMRINSTYRRLLVKKTLSDGDKMKLMNLVVGWGKENDKDITGVMDLTMGDDVKFRHWLEAKHKEANNG